MMRRFLSRLRRGQVLGNEAIGILFAYPKLLLFPVLSGSTVIALFFILQSPVVIRPILQVFTLLPTLRFDDGGVLSWLTILMIVSFVLVSIILFFNVALAASVIRFDRTGSMSLRHGLGVAINRLPQIFAWALFTLTIGIVLNIVTRFLEQYLSWFGWLLGSFAETTFAVATYFVVPVLAVDGVGPTTALRRSVSLIKAKWGTVAGAEFSTFWYFWPLHLICLLAFLSLTKMPHEFQPAALASLIICSVVVVILNSVTNSVITSRLFTFASSGQVPNGSDPAIYEDVFTKD